MIVGLHGEIASGKDQTCQRIRTLYPDHEVTRVAFGDAMKLGVAKLFDVSEGFIEQYKRDSGATFTLDVAGESWQNSKTFTLRQMIQRFGTEACKTVFGEQVWVDRALPWDIDHEGKIVCVTDVRFLNEATRVKNLNGIIIHVVNNLGHSESGKEHVSEKKLPEELIDYTIVNVKRDDNFRTLDSQIIDIMTEVLGAKV